METSELIPPTISYDEFLKRARVWEEEAQQVELEIPTIDAKEGDTFDPELDKNLGEKLKEITRGKINTYKYHQVTNEEEEKGKFFEAFAKKETYEPSFKYSNTDTPSLEDAYETLRELKEYREKIGRKTPLARLYTRISIENSRMVVTAALSQKPGFSESSKKLYKSISEQETQQLGKEISAFLSSSQGETQPRVNAQDAVETLNEIVEKLGLDTTVTIQPISEMTSPSSASAKNISIREDWDKPLSEAAKVLAHEPGHSIIQARGKNHLSLSGSRKTPQGLQVEEGLNIVTEQMIFGELHDLLKLPTGFSEERDVIDKIRAYAVKISEKSSFSETFNALTNLGVDQKLAWSTTLRVKRGLPDVSKPGANYKDISYYLGLKRVKKALETAQSKEEREAILDRLSQGRFSIEESAYLQKMRITNETLPYKQTYLVILSAIRSLVERKIANESDNS